VVTPALNAKCNILWVSKGVAPLSPGHYTLEFQVDDGGQVSRKSRPVDIETGHWVDLYALGAKAGPIHIEPYPKLK
jgi:hypothetical protein